MLYDGVMECGAAGERMGAAVSDRVLHMVAQWRKTRLWSGITGRAGLSTAARRKVRTAGIAAYAAPVSAAHFVAIYVIVRAG